MSTEIEVRAGSLELPLLRRIYEQPAALRAKISDALDAEAKVVPFKAPRNKSRFVRNLAKEAGQQIRVCVVKQLIDSDIRIDGFG